MHYLEKITKIEFQSFEVKKDTKALSKIAKEVSRIQSMFTSYRARTKWAFLVQSSQCPPTKLVGVCFVSKLIIILAKAGMTYKCVLFSF